MVWIGVAQIIIVLFATMLIATFLKPFAVQRFWYVLGILFALGLAIWGFKLTPDSKLDLYRLNILVDEMRMSDSLAGVLVANDQDIYGTLVFFRILCFLVSRTDTNSWLPFIAIFTTVSLVFYVLIDYLRSEHYSTRAILPSLAVIFMGMQMQYVFSGIRNALAIALTITALYLAFYKKRGYLLPLLLYMMAVTTHQMVFILLPTVLVCRVPKGQLLFRGLALCAIPIIFALASLVVQIPNAWVQSVGTRILYYTDREYIYDRPEMIANIAVFAVVGLAYWILRCSGYLPAETPGWKTYMNAYYFLGCVMVGCVVHRDFSLRIGYIMGIAAVPVLCRILFTRRSKNLSTNEKLVQCGIVLALLICCAKVYYDSWYVFSVWEFDV